MTKAVDRQPLSQRIRASESAIRAALKAIQDAGLPVEKLLVKGGQVEIHCRPVEGDELEEKNGGLKDW